MSVAGVRCGFVDTLYCIKCYAYLSFTKIFTARRYAKRGICRRRVSVRLCVCVCVCVSVTRRILSKRLNVGSRK